MKKLFVLIAALSVLSFGAMAQKKAAKPKLSKPDKEFLSKQPDGIYAKFETSRGDIYTVLEHKQSPLTVANFVGLAEGTMKNKVKPGGTPYYDGVKFHRVIPGFMIQGGCPLGTGGGDPGYSFDDELDPNSEIGKNGYKRGVLAMANRGPNTNGSQFFIMHKDYGLPLSYTIFGHVVKGIEIVDSVASTACGKNDAPVVEQKINKIVILRKGKEAEAFDAPKTFEIAKVEAVKKAEAKRKEAEEAAKKQMEVDLKLVTEQYPTAKATESGLRYIITAPGAGTPPTAASTVKIHYTGTLLNGFKFDSSVGKKPDGSGDKEPVVFPLPNLIKGWQEGLPLIGPGGKITLVIPPHLGWGPQAAAGGAIPANSWTVFEIELFEVVK